MHLKVGDYVEIIGSSATRAEAAHLIGRRGMVISTGILTGPWRKYPGEQYSNLSPSEINAHGWYSRALRKISPPDWEAPRVRTAELQT